MKLRKTGEIPEKQALPEMQVMPESTNGAPPIQAWGLMVRGRVERRIRRVVGDNHTEVVTYTLGPRSVMVDEWAPERYYQTGEFIELAVEASVYGGRVVFRIIREEEF